jgi:hypothetical protein
MTVALGHPLVDTLEAYLGALPERGAERLAQDRRAEELECAI